MNLEQIGANAGAEMASLVSSSGLEKLAPEVADAVLIVVRGVILGSLAQRLQAMHAVGFPEADLENFKQAFTGAYAEMIDSWIGRCRVGALN